MAIPGHSRSRIFAEAEIRHFRPLVLDIRLIDP